MFYRMAGEAARPEVWAAEDSPAAGADVLPAEAPADKPTAVPEAPADAPGDAAPVVKSDAAQALSEPSAPKPEKPPVVDWRERRIAQLTAKLREAEGRGTPKAPEPVPAAAAVEADLNARAAEMAKQLEATREFNRRCDETAQAGRVAFGEQEFNGRVASLVKIVDPQDPAAVGAYNLMLDAAIETGEGPRIIHALGADPNEAARLLALSPVKMAIELAKLAQRKPTEVSGAPKPITPIGNKGTSHTPIDPNDPVRAGDLSTAEWMRRRETYLKEQARA